MKPAATRLRFSIGVIAAVALQASASRAEDSLVDAVLAGKPIVDLRYRFEHVDQDGLARRANASTLRTRLGYETQAYRGFHARVELENVSTIGAEQFNDTINGKTGFPVVADPEATELDQAYLDYDGPFQTGARFGRQRILRDNQRFVGAVAFRQNEQTFDAVSLVNETLPDTRLQYAYIFQVQRIFGDDSPVGEFDSDTHLVNAAYSGWRWGTVSAYAYLVDLDNAPGLSSQTYGLRFAGDHRFRFNRDLGVTYAAEYAHQRDYGGNPGDLTANYGLVEPGLLVGDLTARLGYEMLGGDGTNSFQTPLATLHAFNGVTDKFLTTPPAGLEDFYAKLGYAIEEVGPVDRVSLGAAYHDFSADEGGAHFGSEWSVSLAVRINRYFGLSIQFADYDADTFATDTRKLWVTAQFTL